MEGKIHQLEEVGRSWKKLEGVRDNNSMLKCRLQTEKCKIKDILMS